LYVASTVQSIRDIGLSPDINDLTAFVASSGVSKWYFLYSSLPLTFIPYKFAEASGVLCHCAQVCVVAYQLLVYNDIPDPSFIMGGWATAEFVVSIAHNLLISESFSDGSNRSFPPMLI
jgi:hypothetical protein